jgi:hypothetical protein
VLTLRRGVAMVGLVVIVGVAALIATGGVGWNGLQDKVDVRVVAGELTVSSCWSSDRLISLRVVRLGGSTWSAVERDGDGLALNPAVTIDQVAASGLYDVSGPLPHKLAAGDRVFFETTQEGRNFFLTESMVSNKRTAHC